MLQEATVNCNHSLVELAGVAYLLEHTFFCSERSISEFAAKRSAENTNFKFELGFAVDSGVLSPNDFKDLRQITSDVRIHQVGFTEASLRDLQTKTQQRFLDTFKSILRALREADESLRISPAVNLDPRERL
jgi:hypothetical protein